MVKVEVLGVGASCGQRDGSITSRAISYKAEKTLLLVAFKHRRVFQRGYHDSKGHCSYAI
jgi:hypothetical protein